MAVRSLMLCQLHAKTSVAASNAFEADRIWLNGKYASRPLTCYLFLGSVPLLHSLFREEDINNVRLQNCLRESKPPAARP